MIGPRATSAALYALVCLIWGSTWLVIKVGLVGVPPFLGAGLRFALAALVLYALIAARGVPVRLDRGGWISVLSCGLLSFTFSYACVYWSEQYISSGLTATLYCLMPLVTALLSRFWTRTESLSARKIGGILVAIAGVFLLFRPSSTASGREIAGTAVALLSVVTAAVNLVTVKKYGRETDVYVLNALGMTIGAVGLLILSAVLEPHAAVAWNRANVLAIVYLGLVGSVVVFLAYFTLVKMMEATRLSLTTLICPLIALFLGRIFLREAIPSGTWAGMATVMLGVAISLAPGAKPSLRGRTGASPA